MRERKSFKGSPFLNRDSYLDANCIPKNYWTATFTGNASYFLRNKIPLGIKTTRRFSANSEAIVDILR